MRLHHTGLIIVALSVIPFGAPEQATFSEGMLRGNLLHKDGFPTHRENGIRPLLKLLPSVRGLYFVHGPFSNSSEETGFEKHAGKLATAVSQLWNPVSNKLFNNIIFPITNTTVDASKQSTLQIEVKYLT